MAFIVLQIPVFVLLFCVLRVPGRICDDNVADTSTDDNGQIRKNLLDIEYNTLQGNGDEECINTFAESATSVNQTDSDVVGDDVPSGTSIWSQDNDTMSTTDPNIPAIPMKTHLNIGFGEIQSIQYDREATQERLIETLLYMHNNYTLLSPATTQEKECRMHHELCAYWAARGECEERPAYMRIQCAPTCFSCQDIYFEHRCPMPNKTAVLKLNAWQPGDLNRMFERIVALYDNGPVNNTTPGATAMDDELQLRPITILSHPGMTVNNISAPWVVQIEDFLTAEECDTLIQLGTQRGYQRSTGLNMTQNADGTYGNMIEQFRTSTNAWCLEECHLHPTTQTILQRIEDMTSISDSHSEYLQLLHYDVGQFYNAHHDYIDFHLNRSQGVRLATVFLYLNDVEEGGGTNFPELNLTVETKRGRAVIWPSVFDSDPDAMDPLTKHQALPVIKGVKYGANSWIHQRDFKAPFKIGCT